jgi:predicted lipoprotein with Yx(FWY)xxD motif
MIDPQSRTIRSIRAAVHPVNGMSTSPATGDANAHEGETMYAIQGLRGWTRRGRLALRWGSLLTCAALFSAACSSSGSPPSSSPAAPTSESATASELVIDTTHTSLGTFLTADNGRTVYLFEKDKGSKSTCFGACATGWPPVTTSAMSPSTSGKANASLLGTTTRPDGTIQVTYAGHPVYFYSADTASGQTNGEGVDAFGAEWYVISPAGNKVEND